jgi:hypothetical protein
VEVQKLISALEETLLLLRNSHSSDWAPMPLEELIEKIEVEIIKAKNSQPMNSEILRLLFAPTGAIQEAAIDNGWTEQYLKISEIVGQFTIYR